MKSSLTALPLPDTISALGPAQGPLVSAVSTNNQQTTNAVKPKDGVTTLEQQQAAQSGVTAARLQQGAGRQQASSLIHAVQNKVTAASTTVMPGQQAGSSLPTKPASPPLRPAGATTDAAGTKTGAAGPKTDAAGPKTDAAGANPDAAGAKINAATSSQSQGDPVITATSPSISSANANASPAKSETAHQSDAEQSQEADMTATPDFESAVRRLKPYSIVPLFDGGDFDAGYNDKYQPVEFVVPAGLQKAVLEAVITGVLGTRLNQLWTDASFLISGVARM